MLIYAREPGAQAQQIEMQAKQARIMQILSENNLDALIIYTQKNFAWATAGANNWVSLADERGVAVLVFRADGVRYVVTENIERPKLIEEEKLEVLGFEVVALPWWESARRDSFLLELAGGSGKRVGSDWPMSGTSDISGAISLARWSLTPGERERYRMLGQAAGEALEETCLRLVPGDSEWAIGGQLTQACYERGLVAPVVLVASDERIFQHRHPLPTHKKVESYVMVVLCARAGGLIASCTRLVHFGPVLPEIIQKQRELQTVDATFNLYTKPGKVVGEVFQQAQAAYAYAGYADEWQLHHQGGATGYAGRDYRAGPDSQEVVQEWQAFAWNPSITGTKSEDTVLVSSEPGHELEVLTRPVNSQWPMAKVTIEGVSSMERPEILEK